MAVPLADADCYELNTSCYAVYGFEYEPGFAEDSGVRTFFPTSALADAILSLRRSTSPGSTITRLHGR